MGILLVYDVTDEKTFLNIRNWIRNIEQHASENVSKILIGNKCDKEDTKVVDSAKARALANEYGIPFLETSAKTNVNVEEAFLMLTREIKEKLIDSQESAPADKLDIKDGKHGGGKCKCG
eukprot:GABW01001127.1.p1 GENE.GABW01001127.1~~GABW01001127.1.p1  ORF type:complete len:120 (+),score=33.11 GABW01001127.1:99-458(+)